MKNDNNVLSVGKLEKDGDRWIAHMQNGMGTWIVGNAAKIPSRLRDDCEYHVFHYAPSDQFCYFVDLHQLQEQAESLVSNSVYDGHELPEDARKFLDRIRTHDSEEKPRKGDLVVSKDHATLPEGTWAKELSANTPYLVEWVHPQGLLVLKDFLALVHPDHVTRVPKS